MEIGKMHYQVEVTLRPVYTQKELEKEAKRLSKVVYWEVYPYEAERVLRESALAARRQEKMRFTVGVGK